ncbi:protein transport protein bet1 [Thoreauomyces humboldtii]|nr:protein transport protein bet1 [Thoreauomyces humboldtii]
MSQRNRAVRPQYNSGGNNGSSSGFSGGGSSYLNGGGGGGTGLGSGTGQAYHYGMENDNDEQVDVLGNKVSMLKQITIQINEELNLQKNLLNAMEDDFDSTSNILASTMKRFTTMAKTQNGRWMWYLVLFVTAVFLYIYLARYRK